MIQNVGLAGAGTIAGAALQYWLALKKERRADDAGVSRRFSLLFDQLQKELERSNAQIGRYSAELELLRTARYGLEGTISELRDHAVAARAMVHELQRRAGVPETPFPPLPMPTLAGARAPPAG